MLAERTHGHNEVAATASQLPDRHEKSYFSGASTEAAGQDHLLTV